MEEDNARLKDMRKNLKRRLDAAEVVSGDGHLKSPMDYAGLLISRYKECLIYYLKAGDKTFLQRVFALVSREKDLVKLVEYAEYLMPIHINVGNDDKGLGISRRGDRYEPVEEIDFQLYKKLSEAVKVNNKNVQILKEEVAKIYSGSWKKGIERFLRWPTTDAPDSLRRLLADGWVKEGVLYHYGYHVGKGSEGDASRQQRLRQIISANLDIRVFNKNYVNSWGEPLTIERLIKIANTMASMCRNAKRSPYDYERAIAEWERDLEYLRVEFYESYLNLEKIPWPET